MPRFGQYVTGTLAWKARVPDTKPSHGDKITGTVYSTNDNRK